MSWEFDIYSNIENQINSNLDSGQLCATEGPSLLLIWWTMIQMPADDDTFAASASNCSNDKIMKMIKDWKNDWIEWIESYT